MSLMETPRTYFAKVKTITQSDQNLFDCDDYSAWLDKVSVSIHEILPHSRTHTVKNKSLMSKPIIIIPHNANLLDYYEFPDTSQTYISNSDRFNTVVCSENSLTLNSEGAHLKVSAL